MTKASYTKIRRELLTVIAEARTVQTEARRKNSDKGKALTALIIGEALDKLVELRASYYTAA